MQSGGLKSAAYAVMISYCCTFIVVAAAMASGQETGSTVALPANATSQTMSPEDRAINGLPHYQPQEQVSGTIRLCGHGEPVLDFMGKMVKSWEEGFAKYQPGVKFEYDMYDTASAMGALYTGKSDIAILGQ